MIKSSASENPSPWRHISERLGSGSCVSFKALPAMNAEANVSKKRKMFSSGGRSAPSVPGPGGGGGRSCSDSAASGSTREPFPRLAQEIQPEARLALQLARDCTLLAGQRPLAEERVDPGEVVVHVVRADAEGQGGFPGADRVLEMAAFGERDA